MIIESFHFLSMEVRNMKISSMKGAMGGKFLVWVLGLVIGLTFFGAAIGTALNGVAALTNTTLYGAGGVALFGLTGLVVAGTFIYKIVRSGGLM
jgi:hypothetical protein